jgi:hypothetical protein
VIIFSRARRELPPEDVTPLSCRMSGLKSGYQICEMWGVREKA